MFKLTDFLVEDFVKCQFVSLLQILLHHAANTVNTRGWGDGGGGGERIGLIHTIVIRSLRRIRHKAKLRGYVSLLPRLPFVILALVWASPRHLSPKQSSCREGEARGRLQGSRERNTLPWEQVIMRVRLGRINQLAHPTQAY